MNRLLFLPLIVIILSCEDKQTNDIPLVNDISVVTYENDPIEIPLTDLDVGNSELSFEVITEPTHGILNDDFPNITYTPNINFSGEDFFTYRIFDGINYSEIATVTITILPVNLSALYINEFMARNDSTYVDEEGDYDDWLEIYYGGNGSIDLSGFFLTDNVGNLSKWMFPHETIISSSEFLLVWCDEEQDEGELHTNFRLNFDGEFIALVASDGLTIIDSVSFGIQTADISFGRVPDGNTSWQTLPVPSPNSSNGN